MRHPFSADHYAITLCAAVETVFLESVDRGKNFAAVYFILLSLQQIRKTFSLRTLFLERSFLVLILRVKLPPLGILSQLVAVVSDRIEFGTVACQLSHELLYFTRTLIGLNTRPMFPEFRTRKPVAFLRVFD